MPHPQGLFGRSETALLVVDMQNAFCDPRGGLAEAGRDVSAQHGIIPLVGRIIDAAHRAGILVAWTIQEGLGADDRARLTRSIPRILGRPDAGVPESWCIRNTWDAEIVAELAEHVRANDFVVHKLRMSAFYSTTLDGLLRIRQIRSLIVVGVNTEKCVESTVRDASFRDYDVVVVGDAVATTDPRFHDDSLAKIDLYFGSVLLSEIVLDALVELADAVGPGQPGALTSAAG